MPPLSVVDMSPVPAGLEAAQAIRNTVDLAQTADALGYERYWLAEHHGTCTVASPSPEVLIAHVAAATSRIRVGAGGIMLPYHAPLRIAEAFKVLETLYPGRIDLGVGRPPPTDDVPAHALRDSREPPRPEDFGDQLAELLAFGGVRPWPQGHEFASVRAIPEGVPLPPVYLLGSSEASARAAAAAGMPFAYARHIRPDGAVDALRAYRDEFAGERPHAILAVAAIVGEDDEHARRLGSSARLSFVKIKMRDQIPLPNVEDALAYEYTPEEAEVLGSERAQIAGGPETVRDRLLELVDATGADEVMVMTDVHDHEERKRSYARLAEAMNRSDGYGDAAAPSEKAARNFGAPSS